MMPRSLGIAMLMLALVTCARDDEPQAHRNSQVQTVPSTSQQADYVPPIVPEAPRNARWAIDLHAAGPVRFGMTLAEASAALGSKVEAGEEDASEGCSYTSPEGMPLGTAFMVLDGRIARLDVDTTGIATTAGAQVGSTESEIRRMYGDAVRTESHPYDGPEWHYLIYDPPGPADSAYGMIFETDGQRVRNYRVGFRHAVALIEGCA